MEEYIIVCERTIEDLKARKQKGDTFYLGFQISKTIEYWEKEKEWIKNRTTKN
jgi:predicted nucleotidyltransferase